MIWEPGDLPYRDSQDHLARKGVVLFLVLFPRDAVSWGIFF